MEIIDNVIQVITKEGYIFHIIEGEVEYIGKDEEEKGPITATIQASEIKNKKVSFITTVNGAKGRKLTYILYVNGEERQRVTTYKATFHSNEQPTKFGEILKAHIDIQLEGASTNQWIPIAQEAGRFKGTLEGNNHKIQKLYIDATTDYQGLFGYNNGNIQNVMIEDGYVKTSGINAGLLVGQNEGKIKNISTTGMVCGPENVGGVVGYNVLENESSVELCTNNATVTYDKVKSTFGFRIGGIIGNNGGKINKCINRGEVIGAHSSGGIAGVNGNEINECINYGGILGAEPSRKYNSCWRNSRSKCVGISRMHKK